MALLLPRAIYACSFDRFVANNDDIKDLTCGLAFDNNVNASYRSAKCCRVHSLELEKAESESLGIRT